MVTVVTRKWVALGPEQNIVLIKLNLVYQETALSHFTFT